MVVTGAQRDKDVQVARMVDGFALTQSMVDATGPTKFPYPMKLAAAGLVTPEGESVF